MASRRQTSPRDIFKGQRVRVEEVGHRERAMPLSCGQGATSRAAGISPDGGRYAWSQGHSQVGVLDLRTRNYTSFPQQPDSNCTWSPAGIGSPWRHSAVRSRYGTWKRELRLFLFLASLPRAGGVYWSPDGPLLASSDNQWTVSVWGTAASRSTPDAGPGIRPCI